MLILGHLRHEGAARPVGLLLAGAGAIDFGATLSGQGLTTDDTVGREWLDFSGTMGAPCLLRMYPTIGTELHPSVVGDEGAPAPADHDTVFRDLLGVSSTAPGIDRGLWLVQPAAVADNQGLPLVFDALRFIMKSG